MTQPSRKDYATGQLRRNGGFAMQACLRILLAVALLVVGVAARHDIFVAPKGESAWALPDLEGRRHTLAEWRGRVVVVNFWATWCANCAEEWPELNAAQQSLAESGVQLIGVALDDDSAVIERFLADHPAAYPILHGADNGRLLSERLGNREQLLPFSVIFDRNGRAIFSQIGRFSREELAAIVSPLLR